MWKPTPEQQEQIDDAKRQIKKDNAKKRDAGNAAVTEFRDSVKFVRLLRECSEASYHGALLEAYRAGFEHREYGHGLK
jgi:hypothetical protein